MQRSSTQLLDTVAPCKPPPRRLSRGDAAHVLQRPDLTAQQRTIVNLRFTLALSDVEIAQHCGLPVQAIREAFGHLAALAALSAPSLSSHVVQKGGAAASWYSTWPVQRTWGAGVSGPCHGAFDPEKDNTMPHHTGHTLESHSLQGYAGATAELLKQGGQLNGQTGNAVYQTLTGTHMGRLGSQAVATALPVAATLAATVGPVAIPLALVGGAAYLGYCVARWLNQ